VIGALHRRDLAGGMQPKLVCSGQRRFNHLVKDKRGIVTPSRFADRLQKRANVVN
jgi:hypothetical protein